MSNFINTLVNTLNGYLWGPIMIVLCLGVAIIYSVVLKFPQIRLFKSMVHYLTKGSSSENGISSFQGFAMALGGRVGVGNIAGVATAIFYGGPGALFWMWIYALLGAASAFAESTAGQIWKTEDNGEYCGGPAQYIARGLRCKPLAILYALAAVLAFGLTGPTVQSYNIADSMRNAFNVPPLVTGIIVAILFAVIVAGGAKRIGSFASYVVPFMAGVYIVLMIVILGANITRVPAMFGLIFRCAFNKEAAFGAIFGSTIMWGVKRGVYSSEAGQGSGAQASSAAEVSHPAKQGLAQAFSVYIDTLVVCTATGLMILCTGCYNIVDGAGNALVEALPGIEAGTGYTQAAIDTVFPGFGSAFIAIAVLFFAFTTLLSFGYYAKPNVIFLTGDEKKAKIICAIVVGVQVIMTVYGSANSSALVWNIADVGVGLIAWFNLLGLLFLVKPIAALLKDFEKQKKLGLDPVFVPEDCGIKNAELWHEIAKEHYSDLIAEKDRVMGAAESKKD